MSHHAARVVTDAALRTDGAEKDAAVGAGQDGLKADAVAAALTQIFRPLYGHALCHRHSTDASGLNTTTKDEKD